MTARSRTGLLAAALIVVCVGVGAALGAGIHPTTTSFHSEAAISVNGESASLHPTSWHTAAAALQLPGVRASIARLSGETGGGLRVAATGDPQSALITISGQAATPAQAELLANSAATVVVGFLRQASQGSTTTHASFAQSTEAWGLGSGIYVLPPTRITHVRSPSHGGAGSLEAVCNTSVIGGCGPYLRIEGAFHKGRVYEARGWVKAPASTRLRLVLGSSATDVGVGATVRGGAPWKQLTVTWAPRSDVTTAITAFQVMSLGRARFYIDDVSVGARGKPAPSEAGTARAPRFETVLPASSAGRRLQGDTAAWAAAGAGAGLLVGCAALAAAASAARRRRQRGAAGPSASS
jgi:hypothetical protein